MKQPLTSSKLRKWSLEKLRALANNYALKVWAFQEEGKTDSDTYKRIAGELIHIVNIIDWKKEQKKLKPKNKY
jgi:hypothetical protein